MHKRDNLYRNEYIWEYNIIFNTEWHASSLHLHLSVRACSFKDYTGIGCNIADNPRFVETKQAGVHFDTP